MNQRNFLFGKAFAKVSPRSSHGGLKMNCSKCGSTNEPDSGFCSDCGAPLGAESRTPRKTYLYALILVLFLFVVAGIGYYKFILPGGAAAVVNGEEISILELEAAVTRIRKIKEAEYGRAVFSTEEGKRALKRLRYEALTGLIAERIMQQAVRRSGAEASQEELAEAFSGAAVRIAISEQWSGAGCGGCGSGGACAGAKAGATRTGCSHGKCGQSGGSRASRPLSPEEEKPKGDLSL